MLGDWLAGLAASEHGAALPPTRSTSHRPGTTPRAGTLAAPFRTPQRAQEAERAALSAGARNVEVVLRGGTYRLSAPLRFDSSDSPSRRNRHLARVSRASTRCSPAGSAFPSSRRTRGRTVGREGAGGLELPRPVRQRGARRPRERCDPDRLAAAERTRVRRDARDAARHGAIQASSSSSTTTSGQSSASSSARSRATRS